MVLTEAQAIRESEALTVIPAAAEPVTSAVTESEVAALGPDAPEVVEAVSYVYAIGRIETRFSSYAVEKEFGQARGRATVAGLTDREALQALLRGPENRYLARQLCWVLTTGGQDTYLLAPRDPLDFELLIGSVRSIPRPSDLDVVIGVRGPVAPAEMCNGLTLPIVVFDQIYSFDLDRFIEALTRPATIPVERFRAAAEQLFSYITRLPDNHGATNEQRALNHVVLRYPGIYERLAEAYGRNFTLASVDVVPSRLTNSLRDLVDVILRFTNRISGVMERWFVRVDVTEEFPFVVSRISPYFNR